MASAVLQRREFGILDPVIGVASAPGTRATAVHVMFGWVEPFGDNCVSVNVAHGSVSAGGAYELNAPSSLSSNRGHRARAIFDLQDPVDIMQMGLAIASLPSHLTLLDHASGHVLAAYPQGFSSCWRLADAKRRRNTSEAPEDDFTQRLEDWRISVSALRHAPSQDLDTTLDTSRMLDAELPERDYDSDGVVRFLNEAVQARIDEYPTLLACHRPPISEPFVVKPSLDEMNVTASRMDLDRFVTLVPYPYGDHDAASPLVSTMFAQISSYFQPLDTEYASFYKRYEDDVAVEMTARRALGLSTQDADVPTLILNFHEIFDSVVEQSLALRDEDSPAHVRRAWKALTQHALRDRNIKDCCRLVTLFDRSIALARNGAFDAVVPPNTSVESLLHEAISAHDRPDETLNWFKYQTQRHLASDSWRIWDSTEQKERIMALAKERDDPTAAAVGLACVTQKEIILVEQSSVFRRKTYRARQRLDSSRESTSASLASRVVAEPDTAFCDVVCGVSIPRALPNHLRLDKERIAAFNILRDTPTCLSGRITPSIQGFRRTQISNLRAPDFTQTPLIRLGVPSASYLKTVRVTFDNNLVSSLDEDVDDIDWELAEMVSERNLLSSATQNANVDAASGLHQLQFGRLPSTMLLHSAVSAFETAEDNCAFDDHLKVDKSQTQSQSAHGATNEDLPDRSTTGNGDSTDLMLTIFFAVHRAAYSELLPEDGIKAAHRRLTAGVRHLAASGIYDFPLFCLVTYGHIGIVLTGWGMKPNPHWKLPWDRVRERGPACASKIPVMVQIMEDNSPIYDLSKPMQALRYALFLLHLRVVHAPRLARRFEEIRETFAERWRSQDGSRELEWTSEQQKDSKVVKEFEKRLSEDTQRAIRVLHETRAQVERAEISQREKASERARQRWQRSQERAQAVAM
ncbi:hypothetical protein EV121DRAFT_295706 [Schizophyllum commune]